MPPRRRGDHLDALDRFHGDAVQVGLRQVGDPDRQARQAAAVDQDQGAIGPYTAKVDIRTRFCGVQGHVLRRRGHIGIRRNACPEELIDIVAVGRLDFATRDHAIGLYAVRRARKIGVQQSPPDYQDFGHGGLIQCFDGIGRPLEQDVAAAGQSAEFQASACQQPAQRCFDRQPARWPPSGKTAQHRFVEQDFGARVLP